MSFLRFYVVPFFITLPFIATTLLSVHAAPLGTPYTLSRRADDEPGFTDDLLLFDAPAVINANGQLQVEMEAYVFGRQIDFGPITDVLGSVVDTLGLGELGDAADQASDRLKLFATAGREGKSAKIDIAGCGEVTLGPTSEKEKGISVTNFTCTETTSGGDPIMATSNLDSRKFNASIFPSTPDGFGIISDIDDTTKVSNVLDKVKLVQATLLDAPEAVGGMPDLYKSLAQSLDAPSFSYVSGSPYQLYPFLQPFISSTYPAGPLFLRNFTVTDLGAVLDTLVDEDSTLKFKSATIDRIHGLYPNKKFLMIGDSGEKDAETYAEAFRRLGDSVVQCIWIRAVEGANNTEARFAEAFKDVPAAKTRVFKDSEIASLQDIDVKGGSC